MLPLEFKGGDSPDERRNILEHQGYEESPEPLG
jgi:hypothetical protein